MSTKKVYFLLVILIASMFFWIDRDTSPGQRVLSMLILVLLSYLLGKAHQEIIEGRNRANEMVPGHQVSEPALNTETFGEQYVI